MSDSPITHGIVDDLRLASRLDALEGRQVRRYLEQHAEPASQRHLFADGDALRDAFLVLNKAVDALVTVASVADAIDHGAWKRAIADELRGYHKQGSETTKHVETKVVDLETEEAATCVVCMDCEPQATMLCGHANICLACGSQVDRCPTCNEPKEKLIKLFR